MLETEFLPELEAGNIGVVGVAIYIEDRYLPDAGLRVALDQIARLYAETQACPQCAICKSYRDIENALKEDKIALLITMEGAEPLGTDLNLLRVFYELGVRSIGTHPCAEAMRRDTAESSLRAVHRRRVSPSLAAIWCENARRSA